MLVEYTAHHIKDEQDQMFLREPLDRAEHEFGAGRIGDIGKDEEQRAPDEL